VADDGGPFRGRRVVYDEWVIELDSPSERTLRTRLRTWQSGKIGSLLRVTENGGSRYSLLVAQASAMVSVQAACTLGDATVDGTPRRRHRLHVGRDRGLGSRTRDPLRRLNRCRLSGERENVVSDVARFARIAPGARTRRSRGPTRSIARRLHRGVPRLRGHEDVTCVRPGNRDRAVVFVGLARAAGVGTDRAGAG